MSEYAIVDRLKCLSLYGMAQAFEDILKLPPKMRPCLEHAVSKMADAETRFRDDKRTARLLKASKIKYPNALLEDVECSTVRNITKAQVDECLDCGFIRRGENMILISLTGCGKSFLASAIAHQACVLGLRALYLNMNKFTEILKRAKLEESVNALITRLDKNDLLVLDDFGLQKMDEDTRHALLMLLDERYDKKSTIICSQLPLDKWYDYIAEPTHADAIMDRLVNSSNIIELKGESMRKRRRH